MMSNLSRRLILLGAVAAVTTPLHAQTVTVRSGSALQRRVAPGATVTVPVTLDLSAGAGTNVSSLTLGVNWRSSRLTFDSIKAGSFGAVTSNVTGAALGSFITSVFDAAGTTSSVTLATAYFTAAATPGATRVSFNPTVAGSQSGANVLSRFTTQPLDVCVAASGFWGDANGDNSVNIIDAQQIARHSVGLPVANETALLTQSDVNADNEVNIIDAQQIARFSVELPSAPRVNSVLFVQPAVGFINLGTVPSGVKIGGSAQLSVRAYDSFESSVDGCVPVLWSTNAPTVATVDSTGRVVGVSTGSATITVSVGGKTQDAIINVGATAGSAASITAVAGDQQWGSVSIALPVAGQFIVRDSAGEPVAGAPVTLTVSAGSLGGSGSAVVNTDGNGIATAMPWLAPATASSPTMQASVGGSVPTASIAANVLASPIGRTTCMYDVWGNRCWGNGTTGQLGNGTNTNSAAPVAIIADLTAFKVSGGSHFGDHFCGLDASGAAYCWGSNTAGQLGDGTRTDRNVPTAVAGGLAFAQLTMGMEHTCGVTTSGDVYCWGISNAGQLGDSTIGTSRIVPTKAKTPAGVVFAQVAAGYNHTCATSVAGDVYCWGINTFGQLGDGTISSVPRPYPALISGGQKLTKIAAGPAGGCGLTSAGAAWCWGGNFNGQLGNGTLTNSASPVLVQGGNVFTAITMGVNRACGEKGTDGENTVWCWGANFGGLGDGTVIDRTQPTLLPHTLAKLSHFGTSGVGHACGLGIGGSQVLCWGGNAGGQLGDGSTTTRNSPRAVARAGATAGAVAFMVPRSITMVPQSSAIGTAVPIVPEVAVFDGANTPVSGATVTWTVQSGGGTLGSTTSVTDASGFANSGGWTLGSTVGEQKIQASVSGVTVSGSPAPNLLTTFIAYGTNTPALAIKISGDSTYSAPNNGGNTSAARVPLVVKVADASSNPIPNVPVVFAVGASSGSLQGGATSVVIVSDANGLATLPESFWTPNSAQPSTSTLTATVAGIATPVVFTQFRVTGNFDVTTCALTAAGAAMCTGSNQFGGIGDGTSTNRTSFTPVSGGLAFTSFAEGISGTKCGLVGTKAYCWGLNSMGQVGDSTQTNRLVPTAVKGGLAFTKLYTQMYTSCGLTTSNQLYCWGWTGNPGWGEGESMRGHIHVTPTLVNTDGLTFTKVGLSDDGMCGLTAGGDIYCKDARYRADGGTGVPVTFIKGSGGPWTDLAVGNTVACALDVAGHAYCIGGGSQGGSGLGSNNGVAIGSSVPTEVLGGISFADIHAGNFRACGRRSNGELYCWGIAPGNGASGVVDRPTLVPGLNVSSVRITSFRNECAKTTTSLLYCWGSNSNTVLGSVGDGTSIDRYSPVAIPNWPDGPPAGVAVAMYADVSSYTQLVNTATATPPSVKLRDRTGAGVAGVTVTFSAAAGNGTVAGGTVVTDASGVATAGSWTMPATAGTARLDVSAPGVPQVTIPATVLPAAATATITTGNGQYLPDFYANANTLSLVVKDSSGATIAGMPVTFTVGASSGTIGSASTITANTNSSGVASAFSWVVPTAIGADYTITATVPGVAPVTYTARRLAWNANGASNPTAAICRLNSGGAAYCWGGNVQGEVGDGTNTTRTVPTAVSGGLTFASLAQGDLTLHTCGLTSGGQAWCWGNNDAGQLGNGTQTNSNVPVAVSGGLTFASLGTGPFSTCGITTGGALYCWGWGSWSFRGDGEIYTIRTAPTLVNTGGRIFTKFAIGGRSLCALDGSGQAYCWGDNFGGHLGTGTTTTATTPQPTSTGLRFTQLSSGYDFNCGVTTGSTVACWGYNAQGAIGNGTTANQTTPLIVSGVTGALEARAGESHACARTAADMYCWGANYSGQIGDATFTTPRTTPTKIADGITPLSIAAFSRSASCASSATQLYCWGSSYSIGDGTGATRNVPTAVRWPEASTSAIAQMAAVTPSAITAASGAPQTVTISVTNAFGTVMPSATVSFVVTSGGGTVADASVVTDASGRASTTWTLAGASGTVGKLEARVASIPTLVITGTVGSVTGSMSIVSGDNQFLPDYFGAAPGLRVKVVDGSGNPVSGATVTWTAASGSGSVSTASLNTLSDGTASNGSWTTPVTSGTNYTVQASVPGVAPVTFTARRLAYYNNGANSLNHALCRLNSTGAAYCWGGNLQGQVGDGSNANRTTPTAVAGGLTFASLARGSQGFHNCALTSSGVAYCWGANEAGQLGNGTNTNSNIPVAVSGGLAFSSLSTGALATCGITTANVLYCWGWGGLSLRGDSTTYTLKNVPTLVNTGGRTFVSVSIGRKAICALDASGQAFCWGENGDGQLGLGTFANAQLPTATSTALRFASLALAADHTCGVTTANTVACWGYNGTGGAGNGSTTNLNVPTVISGISGALEVRSGEGQSCARTASSIYCWGTNFAGQVGDGGTTNRTVPAVVLTGVSPTAIPSFGRYASCASTSSQLYCWGGTQGGIGDGSLGNRLTPTAVTWPEAAGGAASMAPITPLSITGASGASQTVTVQVKSAAGVVQSGVTVNFFVTSGGGSLSAASAVTDTAGKASVGWTLAGATGSSGNMEARLSGVPTLAFTGSITAAAGALSIFSGDSQFLLDYFGGAGVSVKVVDGVGAPMVGTTVTWTAIAGNGTVTTTATNTNGGGIASNTWTTPVTSGVGYTLQASVPGVAPVNFSGRRIAQGNNGANNPRASFCRLAATGAAYCWGGNEKGQVGDGSTTDRTVPTAVSGGLTFASLASTVFGFHNCALTSGGQAYCWGNNEAGQLGNGTLTNSTVPVPVSGGLTFKFLFTGNTTTCGVTTGGVTYCWGWGGYSLRGDGESWTVRTTPTAIATGGRTFTSVAVSGRTICALDASGQSFCWGENYFGQVGDGTTVARTVPVATSTALRFTSMIQGFDNSCGLTTANEVACWGNNYYGAVGNGTTTNQTTPLVVSGLSGVQELQAGEAHVCARDAAKVYCWGSNTSGQVGDGTTVSPRPSPIPTMNGAPVSSLLSFSRQASCAIASAQMYCWGGGPGGIGDATGATRALPTAIRWPEASASAAATIVALTPSTRAFTGTSQTVTVGVRNNLGGGVAGVTVSFVITSGTGSVTTTSGTTDSSGNATTTWTLTGASGSTSTLEARVAGLPSLAVTGTLP